MRVVKSASIVQFKSDLILYKIHLNKKKIFISKSKKKEQENENA